MRTCDFQTIADIIRRMPKAFSLRYTVAKHFAEELKKTNSRFDSAKFFEACGVSSQEEEDEE